jgi:2,3-bisphosphoglycerate-dependent phosphoglycerate mutase
MDCAYLPVLKRWQLNEKFYGALQVGSTLTQGLDKMKIVEAYGEEMVAEWRRSYVIAPPKVFPEDPRHPINDKRYRDVDPALLPST